MNLSEIYEKKFLGETNDYYPNNKTVISSDIEGKPLSLFSDDIWDFSPYSSDVFPSKVYFLLDEFKTHPDKNLVEDLKLEFKLICYSILHFKLTSHRYTKVSTLMGDMTHVRYFISMCLQLNVRVTEVSKNTFAINQFKEDLKSIKKSTQKKRMLVMYKLHKVGQFLTDHTFGFSIDVIDTIDAAVKKLPDDKSQTLIIPSHIYSTFIQNGADLFKEYLEIHENIEAWHKNVAEIKNYGNAGSRSRKGIEFYETLEKYALVKYCNKYSISDKQEFSYHIKNLQFYAYFYFLCFTGMRDREGISCAYDAFQKKIVNNNEVYTVRAYSTKLVGMKRVSALWVTSRDLESANKVAQSICRIGLSLQKHCSIDSLVESQVPLFYSFYHNDTLTSNLFPDYGLTPIVFGDNFKKLITNCVVTQDDFDELVRVQPLNAFNENKNITIGKMWPFTHHQFRRSLAVYCARSGLVSLPSLKNQLKHIEVDMTAYYADGAMFANDLSEQDFITEFQDELIEAECDQYLADTRNQAHPLFGGHGTWLEVNKMNVSTVDFLEDRKKTLKSMKDNRIAYKQTPLGGCTMNGTCDKLSLAHISACVTCPKAIFNDRSVKALSTLKTSLSKIIQRFDEGSPYRQQTDLEIKAIDKLLEKVSA